MQISKKVAADQSNAKSRPTRKIEELSEWLRDFGLEAKSTSLTGWGGSGAATRGGSRGHEKGTTEGHQGGALRGHRGLLEVPGQYCQFASDAPDIAAHVKVRGLR